VVSVGCVATRGPSVAEAAEAAPPPGLVAEFRSEQFAAGAKVPAQATSWRIWRESGRVWRESPDLQVAELWQLDGSVIFHTRYFIAERRGIEFQPDDLAMIEKQHGWAQIAQLVPPEILRTLPVTESGVRDGHNWRRYQGEYESVRWDVTWREDLRLPVVMEREAAGRRERLVLVGIWQAGAAPWSPTPVTDYQVLEFADLGDNERDPFVQRVQGQLGLVHEHAH
jgi:hypothetical protein